MNLRWTTELPTKMGHYWLKELGGWNRPEIVYVDVSPKGRKVEVLFIGDEVPHDMDGKPYGSDGFCLWYGPVEIPNGWREADQKGET